jgi:transcriptional regulator with XRE-family HTH domain
MDRDEAKVRGTALRSYLQSRLPVEGASSITALARKAGVRPATLSEWWSKGHVPDSATLSLLADALGVDLGEIVDAYRGSSARTWVLSTPELEVLLERAVEMTMRRVLAERERGGGA